MTLRVSFPKLIMEALRRHVAAVLITVLAFFIHLISFFLNVQNLLKTEFIEDAMSSYYPPTRGTDYVVEHLTELCSPNMWNAILAMLIGVYLAFDFFRYLHSKKETDFYESMPIRKQARFKTLFIACIGTFIVLSVVTLGMELAIVYGVGYGSAIIFKNMLWSLICMIGCFLACFTTTVLAMVMTGHSIVAFLGLGVFVSYIPLIISNLIPLYAGQFFKTYVHRGINEKYFYFSPITLAYKATYHWNYNSEIWNIKDHWTYLLGCFLFALVISVVAYLLFLRRPSETAGRAMAFEKFNPVIRIMLVIPIALYAGLLLNEIAAYANTAWLIFGLIFVAFLMHGIMECIFQFDIKALISKKKQLLFTILFCLAFVFVFWTDLFKYDAYMPDKKDVKSIQIDTYLFDEGKYNWKEQKDWLTGESIDLALEAIKDIKAPSHSSGDSDYIYMNDFTVTYKLKSGFERQRRYSYYGNEFPESLDKLSATEDFKNDYCILYHTDEIEITSLQVSNGPEQFKLNLTKEQIQELCEIYLKEYSDITLSDSLSKEKVLMLIVEYPIDGREYSGSESYMIYSDFTETISYLKQFDVVSFAESADIKLEYLEFYSDKYGEMQQEYINDEEQLNALKQYMILGDFMRYQKDYGEDYINCNVRYVLDGERRYMDIFLNKNDIAKVLNQ